MPDITKNVKVTFAQSLPMGTRGTFTHDGELWIAYTAKKNQALFAITDRMLGILDRISDDMVRWINDWPGDALRVTGVMERVSRIRGEVEELTHEKTQARIS